MVELADLFGRDMKSRGKAYILQLGSMAAYVPLPQMVVYFTTKSFVLGFVEALANKPRDSGATVVVLCPGVTNTDFCEHGGVETSLPSKAC